MRRYASARDAARAVAEGLPEEAFHRAPPGGGWSVGQCLEHLVIADRRMVERLEGAIRRARDEGRLAPADQAAAPFRLSWFDRLFIAGTAGGQRGRAPRIRVRVRPKFDPGDPVARGRTREQVLGEFLALQDRLDAAAMAADGLDLSRIRVASVLADWVRVSLGAWFLAIAGHHERHLDQARRVRAAIGMP